MMHTVFIMFALVICSLSVFLVSSCEYEDGLFGRIALALIALSEFIIIVDALIHDGDYGDILPTTLTLQIGIGIFLIRHAYRFLRWRNDGEYDWRPARK